MYRKYVLRLNTITKCTTNSIWLLISFYPLKYANMPAASSSTSAANSSLATGTSAQSALKRFKFLSEELSQSAAGHSMNRGSTCASVHDQIEQHVNELCSTSPEEDALSFWQTSGILSTAGATGRGPVVCPQYLRLMWSVSSLSVAGWQQDEETAWQRILELRVFLNMNNGLL